MTQLIPDARIASASPLALALAMLIPSTGMARSGSRPSSSDAPNVAAATQPQVGVASWHAPRRSSREARTASGRPWNGTELIAAHRSLPFGSRVRVVNLRNGRNIIVQITDRGPYARGRIIDLSQSAAVALDFIHAGSTKVQLERLPAEAKKPQERATKRG